jgi:hypothetical protein
MMEDSKILTTAREETNLYDGREWRINYWHWKKDRIYKLLHQNKNEDKEEEEEYTVKDMYDEMPEETWLRE